MPNTGFVGFFGATSYSKLMLTLLYLYICLWYQLFILILIGLLQKAVLHTFKALVVYVYTFYS